MPAEERVDRQLINHEKRLDELDSKGVETSSRLATLEKQVDFFVKANLPPSEGVLNAKSWWSGYEFAARLVRSAGTLENNLLPAESSDQVYLGIAEAQSKALQSSAIIASTRTPSSRT